MVPGHRIKEYMPMLVLGMVYMEFPFESLPNVCSLLENN